MGADRRADLVIATPVIATARSVRVDLLARATADRDLAGECALASMQIAETLGDVDIFRLGFFMRSRKLYGRRGRYPHAHAWCRIGSTIVDATATQFGRYPAVYVVAADETDRYIERADGVQAIDTVMKEWLLHRVPEYRALRHKLRALDDGGKHKR